MKFACSFLAVLLLAGCAVGHQAYVNFEDSRIGKKMSYKEPFIFDNAGKLVRADFVLGGQGLTHISTDRNGDRIYHFSVQEVLPNFHRKEWVGKCLTYSVVDQKTFIIKAWGFDAGGNPLSCRTWN
ncbi:MAG: hypothetical protein V7708_00990 [Oceanicoccus sp.]